MITTSSPIAGHPVELSTGPCELRRLGLDDIDFALEVVTAVLEGAANRSLLTGEPFNVSSPPNFAATMAAGFRYAKHPLREWLQSLVPEDRRAAITLPDWGKILLALTTHPDALDFLVPVRQIMKSVFVEQIAKLIKEERESPPTSPSSST